MHSRALCVSIHDVAPETLGACRHIAAAVHRVDPSIPLTLLIVPRYHGATGDMPPRYREWIDERIAGGDALALHGFTHSDDAPAERGARLRRSVYTAREGEFAALTREEATQRIELGRAWLARQGWSAEGFVAPAWLLSDGAWEALRSTDFLYTTTLGRFHVLPARASVRAPTVVYSARSAPRRLVSRAWNAALAAGTRRARLVRFGFHPADAEHPKLLAHAIGLLQRLAEEREALTKPAYAHRYVSFA